MPTANGTETLGEKLTRLLAELTRVRTVIQRAEEAGQSMSGMGSSVTLIQYEQALRREARLVAEISSVEARLAGVATALPGFAVIKTKMPETATRSVVQ